MKLTRPLPQFESIVPGVYLLRMPFFDGQYDTAVVLIRGRNREETALIDSGERADTIDQCLIPALEKMRLSLDDIGWLLCTHTHGDHIGGHERIRACSGIHTAAIVGSVSRLPGGAPDKILQDGDCLFPGLRMLHTSGHDWDSVSWLHEESGTLITGDSFQAEGTAGVGVALFGNREAYEQSIRRMRAIHLRHLVAGHAFSPFDFVVEGEGEIQRFWETCLETPARYARFTAQFLAQHPMADVDAVAAALVESEGRTLETYIVRGDHTVAQLMKAIREDGQRNITNA